MEPVEQCNKNETDPGSPERVFILSGFFDTLSS